MTGLKTKATNREADKVMINVIGKYFINSPTTPGHNTNGENANRVVMVEVKTGIPTSFVASRAAFISGFPSS